MLALARVLLDVSTLDERVDRIDDRHLDVQKRPAQQLDALGVVELLPLCVWATMWATRSLESVECVFYGSVQSVVWASHRDSTPGR